MGSARALLAVGAAAAAGAGLLLSGRAGGSVITALALVLLVRAAAASLAAAPVGVTRALTRQVAVAPAWVGLAIAAAIRAGSPSLSDVRGANAVAGLALTHGPALLVVAAWVALATAVLAIATGAGAGGALRGRLAPEGPAARLDGAGVLLQAVLVTTMLAGPQITGAIDALIWVVAAAAVLAAAAAARPLTRWDRADVLVNAMGLLALGLAIGAPRL